MERCGGGILTTFPRFRYVVACTTLIALTLVLLTGALLHSPTYATSEILMRAGYERSLKQADDSYVKKPKKKTAERVAEQEEKGKKTSEVKQQEKSQQKQLEARQASICEDPKYNNVTLQVVSEMPFTALFPNKGKEKEFEGSDIIQVGRYFYVVFDNSYSIGRIDVENLVSHHNALLTQSRKGKTGSSQYEAIAYDNFAQQFYVLVESEPGDTPSHNHGVMEQMRLGDRATFVQRCNSEFTFDFDNKGFEGAAILRVNHRMYMIGLCEGNFCTGGMKGREIGNGILVVMQRQLATATTDCMWRTIKQIPIPSTAAFEDYSALALRPTNVANKYDIAISSQANSQLWVGQLTVGPRSDLADWQLTNGSVFNFPRDMSNCGMLYCSIEGIAFFGQNQFVAVSDVGGGTGAGCAPHDESIHIFKLP